MITFKIRYKFLFIATIGLIAIISMMLLAQNISKESIKSLKNVFENSKRVEHIEQDFVSPLFHLRELSLSLVMAPNETYRDTIRKNLLTKVAKIDKSFLTLDANMQNIWSNYKKLVFLTDKYIQDGFEEGAFSNANTKEREQFYILINKLSHLQKQEIQNSYNTFKQVETSFSKKQTTITTIALLVIVLSFILYFTIANKIVLSIDTLQKGLKRFFDLLGRKIDMNEKIEIKLNNRDEFYQMSNMINENVEIARQRLKKDIDLIKNATNVVNELKIGHLDRRFEVSKSHDELDELKQVLNQMLDNLEERIKQEIKQRTQKEQLLIQQSKLATMGEMIGNIAHQWRQPLSEVNSILMRLQVKKEHNDLSDTVFTRSIEECEVILSHMSNTISDFQNFFKPSKEKTYFSLQKACKDASFIVSSSLKHNHIDFIMDIEQEAQILGYPREFSQAILNLLSNAKDILIDKNIKNPFIKLTIAKGKKYALVSVEDNAGGVNEELKERIFEPYFTTKHAKQGTGIGLYMCKTIIEKNMEGFINVKNTENGALFVVKLSL